jgi:hypothetical protein
VVPTDTVPPNVDRLAAERRLGRLVASRGSTSTRSGSAGFLLVALGALVVGVGLGAAAMATDTRQLGIAALGWVCALTPVLLIWAVRIFVRGDQAYYLYEGGLVHAKNGRPRLIGWRDIVELRRLRVGARAAEMARGMPGGATVTADTVAGYEVHPAGGGKLTIRVGGVSDPGYAAFCGYLEQAAGQSGARLTG